MSDDAFTVHAEAFKTAITEKLQAGQVDPAKQWQAFDYDELNDLEVADVPLIYVVVTLTRRFGGTQRLVGMSKIHGWRLTTEVNAPTVNGVRWAEARIAELEGQVVAVPDFAPTQLEFESAQPPERDENLYTATTFWTFASSPSN